MMYIDIENFITESSDNVIIDVRSPGEYDHAHMQHAVNIPLFDNEERAEIGTLYKKQSRKIAIKKGLDVFGLKMKAMVEQLENIYTEHNMDAETKAVYVYCWRGGMRSGAVSWLFDLYGFKVHTLQGGYKAYRNWVLSQFEFPYKLKIICGYTGVGKTRYLKELEDNGESIIDLETLACHKGSVFGNIDMPPQPSQEMFENILAHHLSERKEKLINIEDESQRLGHVYIPSRFFDQMRNANFHLLSHDFETRLNNIIEEYGKINVLKIEECILRIQKRLGGKDTKDALKYLHDGDIASCFAILIKYYDRWYDKNLQQRMEHSAQLP